MSEKIHGRRPRKDITGNKYNMLTVQKYTGNMRGIHYEVECRCDCGNAVIASTTSVVSGGKRSCGCHRVKHGMCGSPEYSSWKGMKSRCGNTRNPRYKHYGGRGLRVCDRWLNSFENFIEDMGEKPSKAHSIERLDVDKGYSPENCIWATPEIQSRNKRHFGSKTDARGVHPMPGGNTYKASISCNNKTIHIGVYGSIEEAVAARKEAEEKYWGEAK